MEVIEGKQAIEPSAETEQAAIVSAADKTNTEKRGLNTVITLFAILILVILLIARGVDIDLVAGLTLLGLIGVWFLGRRRGKQLYARFYVEELSNIQRAVDYLSSQNPLTGREVQALNFAGEGFSNKQIGAELGISESTVKYFISSYMTKLDASDRTHAVVLAIKRGIISI